MTDIVEKLTFWETVYPEDMEKEEGNLYVEARSEIIRLRACLHYASLYVYCTKQLKAKKRAKSKGFM
jgi:hypothetical protein